MNTSTLALPSNQSQKNIGDAYLRLQLDQKTSAALPMKHTQEVLVIPTRRITPMPNMPVCILGLLNQRNRVLWVVDLAQMLGLHTLDTEVQQYNIALMRVGDAPMGLVVQEVKGVMRFPVDAIRSPIGTVASGITPYLQGCVLRETEILWVLDAESIANSSILHSN